MIVISGVNLVEGGPLSIFYDCLDAIIELQLHATNDIIAFVHSKELFAKYESKIQFIELPKAKKNYLTRLYYEYIYFWNYSKTRDIDVWISLHDITPRVKAKKLYTYCHNPSPFMQKDLSKLKYSVKNVAFSFFYKYLYRINIRSATAIIVQQDWMRKAFLQMYPIHNVIVAHPDVNISYAFKHRDKDNNKTVFIYPAFPRIFKNYEVICQACEMIPNGKIEVWLTLDGSENRYAHDLVTEYAEVKSIKWLGLQPRNKLFELYNEADCMIFPSKLETWGLPVIEFKCTGKDIILADLEYAHETLGEYEKVMFFNCSDPAELAECMMQVVENRQVYSPQSESEIAAPFTKGWGELLKLILN